MPSKRVCRLGVRLGVVRRDVRLCLRQPLSVAKNIYRPWYTQRNDKQLLQALLQALVLSRSVHRLGGHRAGRENSPPDKQRLQVRRPYNRKRLPTLTRSPVSGTLS
jgi:hypothetical protein